VHRRVSSKLGLVDPTRISLKVTVGALAVGGSTLDPVQAGTEAGSSRRSRLRKLVLAMLMSVAVSATTLGWATQASASSPPSNLVAVNSGSTWVMTSNGSSFNAPALWSNAPFYGSVATLSGDLTGNGHPDLVAVNGNSVWVMLSTGSGYGSPTEWSNANFSGAQAVLLADINGDGKADLIAVNGDSVWVMLSTGTGFAAPVEWSSTAFYGSVVTVAGDVSGDGKADLIAVNGNSVWVMTSTGSSFNYPAQWSNVPFSGSVATLVGDVNGDGKADLIAVNDNSTVVMTSNGTAFAAPSEWSSVPFYGSRITVAADVTGDNSADLVAVNDGSTWVMTSTGTSFAAPALWSSEPFYGSRGTLADGGEQAFQETARVAGVTYSPQIYGMTCEEAVLEMALSHEGISVSQEQVLSAEGVNTSVPGVGPAYTKADPMVNFVGPPNGGEAAGYEPGAFYGAIVDAADRLGGDVIAAGNNISPAQVYNYVDQNHPVEVWVTFDFHVDYPTTWLTNGIDTWPWAGPDEHAVLIVGVDSNSVLIDNPWPAHSAYYGPDQWVPKSTFETVYGVYGDMAVVLR